MRWNRHFDFAWFCRSDGKARAVPSNHSFLGICRDCRVVQFVLKKKSSLFRMICSTGVKLIVFVPRHIKTHVRWCCPLLLQNETLAPLPRCVHRIIATFWVVKASPSRTLTNLLSRRRVCFLGGFCIILFLEMICLVFKQESGASSLLPYAEGFLDHRWEGSQAQYQNFRERLGYVPRLYVV